MNRGFRWLPCLGLVVLPVVVPAEVMAACSAEALAAPILYFDDVKPVRFALDITRKGMARTAPGAEPFKVKIRRSAEGVSSFNNEPRYELAALEVSKLLFGPDEQVVPPIVARSLPLVELQQLDPNALESFPRTGASMFIVQCWLADARPQPLTIDLARFAADPVYARQMSRVNVLTYLIEHKDSNLGNVMATGEGPTLREWAIDNGVAFSAEESTVGIYWKTLRVPAIEPELAARLRNLTQEDLAARLAVVAEYELAGSAWVPKAISAPFNASKGVRRRDEHLQLGLTAAEIRAVEQRRKRLVTMVEKGKLQQLPSP